MKTHAFRIHPGQLLRETIDAYVAKHQIQAGVILSCVGHLTTVVLRMADGKTIKTWEGDFEIVSATGTLEVGNSHLHLSVAREDGSVVGGHLKQGCVVGVTAEVVIGVLEGTTFSREFDPTTGFDELVIHHNS